MNATVRLLGFTGSTRQRSSNTALIEALPLLAPPDVEVISYRELARLPHFNPDDERDHLPEIVAALRAAVGEADGLVMSTPEYAHGLPGSFKNLLDWLVGSVTFPYKPVMLVFGSAASVHAPASLREILRTMSATLVPDADVTLELRGRSPTAREIADDAAIAPRLRAALDAFVRQVRAPG